MINTLQIIGSLPVFGGVHICAALVSAAAAYAAARRAAGFVLAAENKTQAGGAAAKLPDVPGSALIRILTTTGWLLVCLELLKQLWLYHDSGGAGYDWWYFPFQLCSVPMYLCISLPFVSGRLRSIFLTFMGGYTFVSAAAALIYPEDILQAAPVLTVHGFVWHAILLFISLLIFMTGAADVSASGLLGAAALFFGLCIIAVLINVLAEPVMQSGNTAHSYAAMFYLNPFHISPQPIVSSIQKTAGIPAGLLLYVFAISGASSLAASVMSALLIPCSSEPRP